MSNFKLDENLKALSSDETYNLVQTLLKKRPEIRQLILEWFADKSKELKIMETKQVKQSLDEKLLQEYWADAREIISEFNEYGGGDYDDEDDGYEYLQKIEKLFEKGGISTQTKLEFIDELFEEYNAHNSGFEDAMTELCFAICKTDEEWGHLAQKFVEEKGDYSRTLAIQIYKDHLHNDKAYLELRQENLRHGSDYWDLAEFYLSKGDTITAVDIAEKGLTKGEGRLTDLSLFLFDHYAKMKDTANVERIAQDAVERKHDQKEILEKLFEYYKASQDYDNAKSTLIRIFGYTHGTGNFYTYYNTLKQFLTDSDWGETEPVIFQKIREKGKEDYIRICLDKNMRKDVVDILLNLDMRQSRYSWGSGTENFDKYARQLQKEFPNEMIKYFWKKAYIQIPNGSRETYRIAADHLNAVRNIYTEVLRDEDTWVQRLSALKAEFKNRRAFLDEIKKL